MPRTILIESVVNKDGEQCFNISGTEDFTVAELADVQKFIARIAYNDSMNLSYFMNELRDEKLFKGTKNNEPRLY